MPLAGVITDGEDTISSNFAFCIQQMQTNFIGYLLQPLESIMGNLGNISFGMMDDITNARNMIGFLRFNIGDIFGNIAAIFANIVTEFMKIMLRTKDMTGKMVGIVVVLQRLMSTSITSVHSMWNGPPGQMVRSMGGGANM
jgi:Co/Zn/Cd efflux system component